MCDTRITQWWVGVLDRVGGRVERVKGETWDSPLEGGAAVTEQTGVKQPINNWLTDLTTTFCGDDSYCLNKYVALIHNVEYMDRTWPLKSWMITFKIIKATDLLRFKGISVPTIEMFLYDGDGLWASIPLPPSFFLFLLSVLPCIFFTYCDLYGCNELLFFVHWSDFCHHHRVRSPLVQLRLLCATVAQTCLQGCNHIAVLHPLVITNDIRSNSSKYIWGTCLSFKLCES